jgi:hypothetical protein
MPASASASLDCWAIWLSIVLARSRWMVTSSSSVGSSSSWIVIAVTWGCGGIYGRWSPTPRKIGTRIPWRHQNGNCSSYSPLRNDQMRTVADIGARAVACRTASNQKVVDI